MHNDSSSPDGICTADLTLEHDCATLESVAGAHLRDSIGSCDNLAMLLSTLCTIDSVTAELQARKKQAESKVHSRSFVAELIAS